MNQLQDSPARSGDPIDEVLRAFFRQQIPQRWPAAPLPPASVTALPKASRSSGPARRRVALAASVGLLVLGSMFVAGKVAPDRVATPSTSIRYDNGEARHRPLPSGGMPRTEQSPRQHKH
jgi:hypothetical protein